MNRELALRLVREELDRATQNFPAIRSPHEGYAIIREEFEELWDEIKANRGTTDRAVSEAVQTAAMAIRYLTDVCDDNAAAAHDTKIALHNAKTRTPRETLGGYSG